MNNLRGLAIIPARGGSKGIPRKNLRLMQGKPLISYSIKNALKSTFSLDVVVSTEDEEIKRIAELYGAKSIFRDNELSEDQIPLDPVINDALKKIEFENNYFYDYVITMQPTSPLLQTKTLDSAIEHFLNNNFETVISGVNKPHLSWTEKNGTVVPNYTKRLNRQYLPKNIIETGAFVITKRDQVKENSRIGNKVSIFELSDKEAIDIDSTQDWWIAEKELSKKNILIRTDGYSEIGLGHIYRSLLLAQNLIDHEVRLVVSKKSEMGIKKIQESNFKYDIIEDDREISNLIEHYKCDILVNDILDTSEDYIKFCKSFGLKVVNFEDLGPGGFYADVVINDLYEKKNKQDNYFWGSQYYCIRDEFLLAKPSNFNKNVEEVLVIFGGTDPSNLTFKVLDSLEFLPNNVKYNFIVGMGYKYTQELIDKSKKLNLDIEVISNVKRMSDYMAKADLAVSSQGRTMLELASMAVPTILMAQNEREQHHEFGYLQNGFLNLGLGNKVEIHTISETLNWLINSPQIREQMKEQMLKKELKSGIQRVINLIIKD